MKQTTAFFLLTFLTVVTTPTFIQAKEKPHTVAQNQLTLERLPEVEPADFGRFSFTAGLVEFKQINFSNNYYQFAYPKNITSVSLEASIETSRLNFFGEWSLSSGLGYTNIGSKLVLDNNSTDLRLHIFSLSTDLTYHMSLAGWMKWLLPFAAGGASAIPYVQSGDIDGAGASGVTYTVFYRIGATHSLEWLGLKKTELIFQYRRDKPFAANKLNTERESFTGGLSVRL